MKKQNNGMKAREIQIGDWVEERHDCKRRFAQVDGETLLFMMQFNSPIEPIPITVEMLEKNGFVKVNSQRYDYGCPDTDCYVKVNPKKNMIHVNGRNANCNLYFHSFVHELQHALRLCGLAELADNFKI